MINVTEPVVMKGGFMSSNFATLVEDIKKISSEDKKELKFLLDRYLIEERRNRIYRNYRKSLKEYKENKLLFSEKTDILKESLLS